MFILGTGPFWIALVLYQLGWITDNNPVGFGILAFLTFWPSVILIVVGVVLVLIAKRRRGTRH